MDRHCKNCNSLVYAEKSYCSSCGSKWIDNRITLRQVAADFSDNYLGIDTKFVRTFMDMFKRPDHVILGYISGRRVNYMDAIRYLLLALFISGIYVLILKKMDVLNDPEGALEIYRSLGFTGKALEASATSYNEIQSNVLDYQGIVFFLTIPIFAIIGMITFWGRRYFNFPEQIVFYMYTYSHFVIATTPITIILLFIDFELMINWSFYAYVLLFLFNAYCYKKCFNLSLGRIVLKSCIGLFYLVASIIILGIAAFALGVLGALAAKKLGYI